ncbi:MAG TPA: HAMP domain-containing methyl-accepting chemotaxis protein [Azospirillum sp.]|nr:HAMP domain-containing methyl-accepting chemotaxis protein [Azospirillum sp.]
MTHSSAHRNGFFSNLRIGTKIYAGFSVLLALLLALAVVAWHNSDQAQTNLAAASVQAEVARAAASADTTLLESRLAVSRFVAIGQSADAEKFAAKQKEMREHFAEAQRLAQLEQNKQAIGELFALQEQYEAAFKKLVPLRQRQNELVETIINGTGNDIRGLITDLRNAEAAARNVETLTLTATLNGDFLVARTVAARFIQGHAQTDRDEVLQILANVEQTMTRLAGMPLVSGQEEHLKRIKVLLPRYSAGFTELADTIQAADALVLGPLNKMGPVLAEKSKQVYKTAFGRQTEREEQLVAGADTAKSSALVVSISALLIGTIVAWSISRAITRPVISMTGTMRRLADGDAAVEIPTIGRKDEVGAMASAVQVFKDNLLRTKALEREAEEARKRAEIEKREAAAALANAFEADVGEIIRTLGSSASELSTTAQAMAAQASQSNDQATSAAAASEQASANVQTVAAASEELSASIREIGQQVGHSRQIAGQAAEEARRTNGTIQSLVEAGQKVGDVVNLINSIASQTNLLALNATIEAARAGEAGKGFAVVAQEVKNLAAQTAKATEDITQQISAIQAVSSEAAAAIEDIGGVIEKMNEIATTVAAAVEEQDAATQEIARNVQEAARGTAEVSSSIRCVTEAASETGAAASQVFTSSEELARQGETLRTKVDRFLAQMRAA